MTTSNKNSDSNLFWPLMALGLLVTSFGIALLYLALVSNQEIKDQKKWVKGNANLFEVGILYTGSIKYSTYQMTVRYSFILNNENYEGSSINSGYRSGSGIEVLSLITPFVPEASQFNLNELGLLKPQHIWSLASQPVTIIYDPMDPSKSALILDKPIANKSISSWLQYLFISLILIVGFTILILAWLFGVPKNKLVQKLHEGIAIKNYSDADRQRLLNQINLLHLEVTKQPASVLINNNEMRQLAIELMEMANATTNGSFVPSHFNHHGFGRGIDEKFCDEKLTSLAYDLVAIIKELSAKKP